MKTYYIVQEKGSEYNDETYDLKEGGEPVKVFENREDAELAADKLNFAKLKTEPIMQYGYETREIINDIDGFLSALNEITGESLDEDQIRDEYDWSLPDITYKQYLKIKNFIELEFYEVSKCSGE